MIREPETFTVTQALDRAWALNQASFDLAHLAREQAGTPAGQLTELAAQLIQAEYYTALNHLHQCLKALFDDPTLARGLAQAELESPLKYVMHQREAKHD